MSVSAGPKTAGNGSIELAAVSKKYVTERVVDRIDLSIRAGEFFSLLGPSGSGKTTTLMMIAGFASVDEGTIKVDGDDISGLPPQKRGFGMVFQNYAVFPHMNVFENVAFPLRARHMPEPVIRERVTWALNLVQLGAFTERYSRQLSGGQQQRVAIARAIVFEPRVVLMDEPLGALDKNLRYDMQVEIKEIQRRLGMTVVYVTHDQEEALNMSDRIAIMNHGRVEQVGAPHDVYEQPASMFAGRFLGEANMLAGEISSAANGQGSIRVAGQELKARSRETCAAGQRVQLFVRPERVALTPPADGTGVAPDMNCLAGTVRRASFLGNIVRYQVEVAPDTMMTIDAQNSGSPEFAVGAPVVARWRIADALLLGR
jgi:putative spermidine/putrescine transport system ATP-binding protein